MRVAVFGTLIVAPLTAVYGFVHFPLMSVGISAVEGVVQALAVPASQGLVAAGAPVGRAAAAQGLAGSATLLVAAVTAYSAGGLYGAVGPEWMFLIAGSGVVLFVMLAVSQHRRAVALS